MTPGEQEPTRPLARLPRLTLFAIRLVRQAAPRLFAASVAGPVTIGILARAASPAPSNPELAPTQAFMRWWSPIAAKRSQGLALSYLWRPVCLACRLPAAVREVRRARSAEARRPRP